MIGRMMGSLSPLVLLAGFFFVLCAVGIVLRRDSKKYLNDSELLRHVSELTEYWKIKTKGQIRGIAIVSICIFAVVMFAAVPLQHLILPAETIEMHNVEVVEALGNYDYWLLDESGTRIHAIFCNTLGYKPPFDAKEIFLVLKFKNRGDCWDMRDMHPKYKMKKNEQGQLLDRYGNLVFPED